MLKTRIQSNQLRVLIASVILVSGAVLAEKPVVKPVSTTVASQPPSPGAFRRYFPTTEIALPVASYAFVQPQHYRFAGKGYQLDIFAKKFAQGEPGYLEIVKIAPAKPAQVKPQAATADKQAEKTPEPELDLNTLKITFNDHVVRLTSFTWGNRGFFPMSPELSPGWKVVRVTGPNFTQEYKIFVQKTTFPIFHNVLYIPTMSNKTEQTKPETVQFIQNCQAKKTRVFSAISADTLSGRLSFPRDVYRVTSPFYAKRVYERFQVDGKKKTALPSSFHFHNGLDLFAKWGDPIFAMADGVATIAENMFYEGGFVTLDHGNGIFTLYMHQSKLLVQEGQRVKAGDLIGLAGATGAANGSHLHVSFYIGGVALDPTGLLSLPVRN